MKNFQKITIVCIVLVQTLLAQYNIKPEAPLNPVPVKFHKDHFFLNGQVRDYQVKDTSYNETNYLFNKKGFLIERTDGKKNSNISPKIIYLYEGDKLIATQYTRFGKAMDTLAIAVDKQNRPVIEKFLGGSVYYEYDKSGNYSAKYTETNGKKRIRDKYEYDKKNRLIKELQYLGDEIPTKIITHSYKKEDGYLKVTTIITHKLGYKNKGFGYKSQIDTTITYYKNGHDIGSNKNYKISFDKHNNPYFDKNGSYRYTYYTNNTVDKGQCISGNCQNGWGTYKDSKGTYTGFWAGGLKSGYGKYVWNTGETYEGSWNKGKPDGMTGMLIKKDTIYYGGMKEGKYHFYGITMTRNSITAGFYSNGKLITPYSFEKNGNKTGCIQGDCQSKFGKYVWDNGDIFTGFWLRGNPFFGIYTFSNGNVYFGHLNENKMFIGLGFYREKSGDYYAGYWINGKKEGKGYYKNAYGWEKIGYWENNQFIKSSRK